MADTPHIDLPATTFPLTDWQAELTRSILAHGFHRWAGLRLLDVSAERAVMAFLPRAEMVSPMGTFNGAILNGLLETPAVLALLPHLQEGERPLTMDIFVQNMKAFGVDADIRMEARVLRRGRRFAHCTVDALHDDDVRVSARITKTILAE